MEEYRMIKLELLHPSPTNPRKHFSSITINELADSIKKVGVIENIGVRKHPKIEGHFEIIYGERRFRASGIAGLSDIPCKLQELSDDQVFDFQITENLQREDVSPLDEAEAFQLLMNKKRCSLEELSARFGKSTDYIFGRMRLTNLVTEAKDLLDEGILPVTAAIRISLLTEQSQREALKRTIVPIKTDKIDSKIFAGLKELKTFTDTNVLMPLKYADFNIGDKKLIPQCGSCIECPNRTGNNLYKDFTDSDKCLDNACYKNKHVVHYKKLQKKLELEFKTTVGFAARQYSGEKEFPELTGIIPMIDWNEIEEKEAKKNKNARLVIFIGPDRGRVEGEDHSEYGWVTVTDRTVKKESNGDFKKEQDRLKEKAIREAQKRVLTIINLHSQLKEDESRIRVATNLTLQELVATTWDHTNLMPQEILFSIIKSYGLSIKCQTTPAYTDITLDKNTKPEDVGYSIDREEILNAVENLDTRNLQRLLNELVFIQNYDNKKFLDFYELDDKEASKQATAQMKSKK